MLAHQMDAPPEEELGGSPTGGAGASTLEVRVNRYGRARARTLEMIAYLAERREAWHGEPSSIVNPWELARRLDRCGDWLRFALYTDVDELRLTGASFCKIHLACALCAVRRGGRMLRHYLPKFEALMAAEPHQVAELATVTVRNGDDLAERLGHLRESWRRVMERRRKPRTLSCLRGLRAAVWSYEVTNIGNGWHPHLHAVTVGRGIDRDGLQEEWHQLTGDSFVVDVRPFAPDQEAADAFCEVFKYAVKFSELSPELRHYAFLALRGRRLVDGAGEFRRALPESASLLDEPLDGPYIEYLYRFLRLSGAYSLARMGHCPGGEQGTSQAVGGSA